jgi:pimeloyl-ACP methyl ester carboxylesterase
MLPTHLHINSATLTSRRVHLPDHGGSISDSEDDSDDSDDRAGNRGRMLGLKSMQRETDARTSNMQQPPLGVTGVICTSHRIPLPHYDIGSHTCNESNSTTPTGSCTFLHYTVFRPRQLKTDPILKLPVVPPLVAVAGGPLLPSYYLQNLVHTITDRAIVLFDPVGCGQSTRNQSFAKSRSSTMIEKSRTNGISSRMSDTLVHYQARDLLVLLETLDVPSVHLLGHSLGGCVAYECVRLLLTQQQKSSTFKLASLVLVSAPVSILQSRQDAESLRQQMFQEIQQSNQPTSGKSQNQEHDEQCRESNIDHLFWQRYECRVHPMPLLLEQSLRNSPSATSSNTSLMSLTSSSVLPSETNRRARQELGSAVITSNNSLSRWAQAAIESYVAAPLSLLDGIKHNISLRNFLSRVLVVRGEFDFCSTQTCGAEAWQTRFLDENDNETTALSTEYNTELLRADEEVQLHNTGKVSIQSVTLLGCAHYSMLENDDAFGVAIGSFLRDCDSSKA